MGTPGPSPSISLEETLEVFGDDRSCTPLTATEVADGLECARRTAYRKLERLAERGDLETKKVGARSRIWWRPVGVEGSVAAGDRGSASDQFGEFVRAVEDYAIFMLDADGNVASWNEGAERIKGYDEDEILGEHFSTFYTDDDIERGVPRRNLETAAEHGRIEDEGWRVRKDGSEFWANVVITAIHDDHGELQGFTKVTRDMTERKRAEDERRLRHSVSSSIARSESIEDGLEAALEDVCELTDWVVGQAWIPTGDGHLERLPASYVGSEGFAGFDEVSRGFTFGPGDGIPGRVLESKEPVWFPDVSAVSADAYPRTAQAAEAGLKAGLGIPVTADGEVVVVLEFYMEERRERDERLVEIVTAVGTELGSLVARKQAEEKLERERERYRVTLENLSDTVLITDDDGEFTYVCPNTRFIFGYTADEVREMEDVAELLGDGLFDVDELHEVGEFSNIERTVTDKHGTEHHLLVTARSVSIGDGTVLYTCRDVTERKQAEYALAKERDLLEQVMEAAPVAISVLTPDGGVERANRRALDLRGLTEADPDRLGAADRTLLDEEGRPIDLTKERPFAKVMETGEPVDDWVAQLRLPDGDRKWLSIDAAPIRNDEGEIERVVTAAEDITELKERTRRLERRRDELKAELGEVYERIDDAFYALDEEWRFTYINERAEEIFGRPEAEVLGETVWEAYPETTEGVVRENYREAMETQEPVNFEVFLEPLDGWIEVNAYPSETGLSVYFRDVTDRKEREQELEQYETIVETMDDGVFVTDEDRRYAMVNDAYVEMTGYPRDELIGAHPSLVIGDEAVEEGTRMTEEMLSGERDVGVGTWTQQTADGEERIVENRFRPLPTDDGYQGAVGVVRDITEREERKRALERYETVFDTVDDGIYILGPGFRFEEVNDAYATMTGYDKEELVGAHCSLVVGEEVSAEVAETVRELAVADDESAVLEADIVTKGGDRIPGESKFTALPSDNGFRGSVGVVRDLTDRKEYERELRRYETLIEESTDVNAILDKDGTIRYVTPSAEYVLGRAPEDLVGEDAFENIHPDDREETMAEFAALVEDSASRATVEFRFRHADGSWVWLESRGRNLQEDPMIDGVVVYTRDITERKEYERELESRARQQEVISELGQYALENPDLDELFAEASRRIADVLDNDYCKVLDLDPDAEELLLRQGVGWRDGIVGDATVSAVETDSQASYTLLSEGPVVVTDLDTETRFSGPDLLTSHDVKSGISTIIGSREDPWGILGTHDTRRKGFTDEDVTFVQSVANVLAEAIERQEYQDELLELVDELEESNERLEQFAYVASHDLQEPLRMVSNYLGLLESRYGDALDEDAREFIGFAVDGADRMRTMIDDLLAYSRVNTQAEPPDPTDCEEVVEHVLANLQVKIEETDAEIGVEPLPTVLADRNQLEQVFQNLVSNAIKYSGDDPPEVEIGAEWAAGEWVFRVADNGIGIEPEHADRIFEVFERLHTREEYSGTGIGLALCEKIVDRHGGDIWVESDPGEGSTFYFTLPATEDDPGPDGRTPHATVEEGAGD